MTRTQLDDRFISTFNDLISTNYYLMPVTSSLSFESYLDKDDLGQLPIEKSRPLKTYPLVQNKNQKLSPADCYRIIEMAWEDRTPFDAIKFQFAYSESQVIELMQQQLKPSSFRLWRQRVTGRSTKHLKKRPVSISVGFRHTAQLNVARKK